MISLLVCICISELLFKVSRRCVCLKSGAECIVVELSMIAVPAGDSH